MHDADFSRLLAAFDFSFAGYRKVRKGVKKRISRHMQMLGCRNMESYLARLDADLAAREACRLLLSVPISRFFRDRALWWHLEERIFPQVVLSCSQVFCVWCAGCARGEEAYTLRILWRRLGEKCAGLPTLRIVATDIHPERLDQARAGVYEASSLKEVEPEVRAAFFEATPKRRFAVCDFLKDGIDWRVHDTADGSPEAVFDAVFLRNSVLTYHLLPEVEAACLQIFAALRPGGFLVVGSHEKLPPGAHRLFTGDVLCPHVYYKKENG